MKITRKTKIRIRKTVAFIRDSLVFLCLLFMGFAVCSFDGPNKWFPIICIAICVVCFVVARILDELLWQTAWKGDKPSPFNH